MDTSSFPPLKLPSKVVRIIEKIRAEGYVAYAVGGALRNGLLKMAIRDWDIATDAPCDRIISTFSRVVPTGIDHGTVTVILEHFPIEVSSFRDEGIGGDLARRDFTINALAYDPVENRWIDPHGGYTDLKAGRVRAVMDAQARFREDPLRVIRAIRIAVELDFRMDREIWAAIPQVLDRIGEVAPERIRVELTRIMLSSRPTRGFRWMKRTGVLKVLFPEYKNPEHALRILDSLPPKPLLRWAGFLHHVGSHWSGTARGGELGYQEQQGISAQTAHEILDRYRFSRNEISRIIQFIRHHHLCRATDRSDGMMRRLLLQFGPAWIEDVTAFCRAGSLTSGRDSADFEELRAFEAQARRILRENREVANLRPVLNGEDIMGILRIPSGPEVGKILKEMVHLVTEDPSRNTREYLTIWVLERYAPRD